MSSLTRIMAVLLFVPWLGACGASSNIQIDIALAVNQGARNPLNEIEADFQSGVSNGVYFSFEPLVCPPRSIEDVDASGARLWSPDPSQGSGSSPHSSDFGISASGFEPTTYYRVRMLAMDAAGNTTHIGIGDCPINLALGGSNQSTICFGIHDGTQDPICPGTTPFSACPGVSSQTCP